LPARVLPRGSAEFVGEVPSAQIARFETDEEVVAGSLRIGRADFWPEVPGGHSSEELFGAARTKLRVASEFDPSVWRSVVTHDDGRARIFPQVRSFHIAAPRENAEAAVAPLVPDRREEDSAVASIRRENRDERELE
jgi:hypothetical protein